MANVNENEETMELMEVENNEVDSEMDDYEETGSGKAIGLVLAGVAGAAALGVTAYKKLKAKKNDGKPRKKKRLKWVEVEEEAVEDDFEDDIIDSEAEEVAEEKEPKK